MHNLKLLPKGTVDSSETVQQLIGPTVTGAHVFVDCDSHKLIILSKLISIKSWIGPPPYKRTPKLVELLDTQGWGVRSVGPAGDFKKNLRMIEKKTFES